MDRNRSHRRSRKEERVARMLAGPPGPVPEGLAVRAARRGERIRRRRAGLRALAVLLLAAVAALAVRAVGELPREPAHSEVTPPLDGW
ncbi:hypothetical protein [Streptomyces clavuligerus]|nr:hypothetical protein [Streptomyces clavuligerus]WDN53696.1 hypothetical protein LL058_18650 [Streptomyces clavuligerus]